MKTIKEVRSDFPILSRTVHGKPLVYLDSAATTLKPQSVIDAIVKYYSEETANVHRGVHYLSQVSTVKYEAARSKTQKFLNAASESEVVFTRGTTESINLIALGFAKNYLKPGDRIICSEQEHHSNMVPWQMLAKDLGLDLVYISILEDGSLDLEDYAKKLTPNAKLVAVNYVSNSLGTIHPVKKIIEMAKSIGALTSIDAAQAVLHFPVDVQDLDCDFLSFSSHKLLGPTGFGVLYSKLKHLQMMKPLFGGGDMIKTVDLKGFSLNDIPFRFEAGTPNIEGAIGFAAAIDYVNDLGFPWVQKQEESIKQYADKKLYDLNFLKFIGTAKNKVPIYSFAMEGTHASDIASVIDQEGIAVRSGHHCTMPVISRFGLNSTCRASFSFYNTLEEVDVLVGALHKAKTFFT